MNIQSRKLELIEQFLHISDESLISKLEALIKEEKQSSYNKKLTPMSLNEFHDIIDTAQEEAKAGYVISHNDLKENIKSWK